MSLYHTQQIVLLTALLALVVALAPASAVTRAQDVKRIDFAGGTVEEYIAVLREVAPELNIILMPDAAGVQIPAINIASPEVSGANSTSLLRILELITDASIEYNIIIESDGVHHVVRLAHPLIAAQSERQRGGQRAPETRVDSYSLAAVILDDHISADDVLRNLEIALEMSEDDGAPPEMRFHESTSLLIVKGTVMQHNAIRNTLSAMQQTTLEIQARRVGVISSPDPAQEHADRDDLIEGLIAELRELRTRLVKLERAMQQ